MLVQCANCGCFFEGKGAQKYCSNQCKKEYATKMRGYMPGVKKCLTCGKEFTPMRADGRFCSRKCSGREKYLRKHPITTRVCPTCNAEFETSDLKKLFCSVKCRRKNEYLNNIDSIKKRRKEQYAKDREANIEKTRQWCLANPEKYRQAKEKCRDNERFSGNRAKALERDGYKCVKCGADSKRLDVHHKDRSGNKSRPNNSLGNLVTLCVTCHALEHGDEAASRNKCEMVTVVCERCGKPFEITPSRYANGRGKYCSRECRWPKKKID
jgi:hypothetical protein